MNSASYEYRNMSTRRGAQLVPIGMPTICRKTFPSKTTKMLSTRNSSMLAKILYKDAEEMSLADKCMVFR